MRKSTSPFPSEYQYELDITDPLYGESIKYFQNLVGKFKWVIELVWIHIHNTTSHLSVNLAQPWQVHLKSSLHTFTYIKNYSHFKCIFGPDIPSKSTTCNEVKYWKDYYTNVKYELLPNMPY